MKPATPDEWKSGFWASGFTMSELERAQERYCLNFPRDLIDLFLDRRPARGYDWDIEDRRIRDMLEWPIRMLLVDVEHGFWWPDWGDRPSSPNDRQDVVQGALATKPRLIPLLGHRFVPETPSTAGNPVFSMYGFDTIYYGSNLVEYFTNEFEGKHALGPVRHIPFWSDIVERHELAYAYYKASDEYRELTACIPANVRRETD